MRIIWNPFNKWISNPCLIIEKILYKLDYLCYPHDIIHLIAYSGYVKCAFKIFIECAFPFIWDISALGCGAVIIILTPSSRYKKLKRHYHVRPRKHIRNGHNINFGVGTSPHPPLP